MAEQWEQMRYDLVELGYAQAQVDAMTDEVVEHTWKAWNKRRTSGLKEELAATQEIVRQLQPGAEEAAMPEAGGGAPAVTPTTAESAPPPQDDLTGMLGEPPPEAATVADEAHGGDTDVDVSPVPQDAGAPGSEWGLDVPVAQEVPSAEVVQESKPSRSGSGGRRAAQERKTMRRAIRMAASMADPTTAAELNLGAEVLPDLLGEGTQQSGTANEQAQKLENATTLEELLERLVDAINRLIDAMGDQGQQVQPGVQPNGSFVPSLGREGKNPAGQVLGALGQGGGGQYQGTEMAMTLLRMMMM